MGSAQPRNEHKMCCHGKSSCCTDARETLARLLKWARYACAPTYESKHAVFNPKYAMYGSSKCMYYANWLNAISIAYKLFCVTPLCNKHCDHLLIMPSHLHLQCLIIMFKHFNSNFSLKINSNSSAK